MQKFGIVRDFVETDCEDKTVIETLKQTILRETDRWSICATLPRKLVRHQGRDGRMKANYISYDGYREDLSGQGRRQRGCSGNAASYLTAWESL